MTMDGGALNLLKTGIIGRESVKQPEIALTGFPKILSNLFRGMAAPFMGWALQAP
jgi:hypothetical protein